jgi:hypothetical protein
MTAGQRCGKESVTQTPVVALYQGNVTGIKIRQLQQGGQQMTEYEIIVDPKEYGIEKLVEGLNSNPIDFPPEEREQWAREVDAFAVRLSDLTGKAQNLQTWLAGNAAIKSTPASLKALKIQLFKINDALDTSMDLVNRLESDIVPPITGKK